MEVLDAGFRLRDQKIIGEFGQPGLMKAQAERAEIKIRDPVYDDGTVEEQLDKILRTGTEMRADPPEWVHARRQREHDFPRDRSEMKAYRDPPYASEQEAAEHAAQVADRYGRAFQRTPRAMRDLRRYTSEGSAHKRLLREP